MSTPVDKKAYRGDSTAVIHAEGAVVEVLTSTTLVLSNGMVFKVVNNKLVLQS